MLTRSRCDRSMNCRRFSPVERPDDRRQVMSVRLDGRRPLSSARPDDRRRFSLARPLCSLKSSHGQLLIVLFSGASLSDDLRGVSKAMWADATLCSCTILAAFISSNSLFALSPTFGFIHISFSIIIEIRMYKTHSCLTCLFAIPLNVFDQPIRLAVVVVNFCEISI